MLAVPRDAESVGMVTAFDVAPWYLLGGSAYLHYEILPLLKQWQLPAPQPVLTLICTLWKQGVSNFM